MSELARRVESVRLADGWTDARARAVARGMAARRRRRWIARAAAGAAVACAVALAALRLGDGGVVRFADGSTARPLDARARIVARRDARDAVVAELRAGGARFEVTHDPSRAFRVDAGDVAVEVIGTTFTVERTADGVRVAVERGRVRVRAASTVELGAGESGLFTAAPPAATAPPPAAAPDWKLLALEGDYDLAFRALGDGPRAPDGPDPVADLLLAADVARLSHHPAAALAPLGEVVDRHPDDPRAPLAAFTLGRVLLDELGRPQAAADAFARARALDPAGPLAADALGREVEAWSRAGDTARARDRAETYLRLHPRGARVNSVRRFGGLE